MCINRLYGYSLVRFGVVIDSRDSAMNLIEADVIESLKAGTSDLAYTVIWDQELLFPAHKHVFAIAAILVVKISRLLGLLAHRTPGGEPCPSFHVVFIGGTPVLVARLKGVFWADDLALKACGEGRMFRSQACSRSVQASWLPNRERSAYHQF